MPELPEIEILKSEIGEHLTGREVAEVPVNMEKETGFPYDELNRAVAGTRISGADRKGKMLIIDFDNGISLSVHLMMVGQIRLTRQGDYDTAHRELILKLTDGESVVIDNVSSKYICFGKREQIEALPAVKKLGIDPLDNTFTPDHFGDIVSGRKGKIKSLLIDQAFIAGIGNTYVDEILFAAGISPVRSAGSLSSKEIAKIYKSIVTVLRKGIELQGSSDIAFVHLDGSKGSFQDQFRVNRRKGKPCFQCDSIIEKTKVGGRGTYFCPKCQK